MAMAGASKVGFSAAVQGRAVSVSQRSDFCTSFSKLSLGPSAPPTSPQRFSFCPVAVSQSGRKCHLTGKKANNGMIVTFSHHRVKKLQHVNLQWKRIWWERESKFVRLKISTKALKTIDEVGIEEMARRAGISLYDYISR